MAHAMSSPSISVMVELGDALLPLATSDRAVSIRSILHLSQEAKELCMAVAGSLTDCKSSNSDEVEVMVYTTVLKWMPSWLARSKNNAPPSAVWEALSPLIQFDPRVFAIDMDNSDHSPHTVRCATCARREVALVRTKFNRGQYCATSTGKPTGYCHRCLRLGRRSDRVPGDA